MIGMDDRGVGATCDDDEIAVPRGQLLELREQLLALGAALNALDALLGVAWRQVEAFDDGLLAFLRGRAAEPGGIDQSA